MGQVNSSLPRKWNHLRTNGQNSQQDSEEQASMALPDSPPPYIEIPDLNGRCSTGDGTVYRSKVRLMMLEDAMSPSSYEMPFYACDDIPWYAELDVFVKDLPKLMKHGLQLRPHHIQPEGSYITEDVERLAPGFKQRGWTHVRRYRLEEIGVWKGELCVFAHEIEELWDFKIFDLTAGNVRYVGAVNRNQELVYNFDRFDGYENFNDLYGDMPLQGLWPWPKSVDEGPANSKATQCLDIEKKD